MGLHARRSSRSPTPGTSSFDGIAPVRRNASQMATHSGDAYGFAYAIASQRIIFAAASAVVPPALGMWIACTFNWLSSVARKRGQEAPVRAATTRTTRPLVAIAACMARSQSTRGFE